MRRLFAIVSVVLLPACDVAPSYAPALVSPNALRTALPEIKARDQSMVRDQAGAPHAIHGNTQIEYPQEPHRDHVVTSMGTLAIHCLPVTIPHPNCELDRHDGAPRVYFENGTVEKPSWSTIGNVSAVLVIGGGIVGGEVYCFADCGTAGKIALASADVALAVVSVALFAIIITAVGKMD